MVNLAFIVPLLLQDTVQRWASLEPAIQQEVCEAVLLAAGEGDWQGLEGRLQLALEMLH
jgi:hypothetical protein